MKKSVIVKDIKTMNSNHNSHLVFILCVVNPRNGSRTNELARSSFSHNSRAFIIEVEE